MLLMMSLLNWKISVPTGLVVGFGGLTFADLGSNSPVMLSIGLLTSAAGFGMTIVVPLIWKISSWVSSTSQSLADLREMIERNHQEDDLWRDRIERKVNRQGRRMSKLEGQVETLREIYVDNASRQDNVEKE